VSTPGKLYLLPVPIHEESENRFIPEFNISVVKRLTHFIAEDAKTARRFLKWFGYETISLAEISLLNEHTPANEMEGLLKALKNGHDVGLMSDAGCPGIADPGADVVKLAHKNGITVIPLVGPSSIVLSIMASGFNGQNFAFIGYLPIDKTQKIRRLKELEQIVHKQNQAQFFIETPYRNEQLFDVLLEVLAPDTFLFIGKELSAPHQIVLSKSVAIWKKTPKPSLHKVPVVYGIYK